MHNLRLKQTLGQNFLRDKNVAKKIVKHIDADKNSSIMEVGPGDGAITGLLIEKFKNVIAIEIDNRFVDIIKEKYSNSPNFTIIFDDFTKIDLIKFYDRYGKLTIVGNIPYNITSSVLFKSFENRKCIDCLYLMVQKEVGDRILSKNKTKKRGILSVLSQYYSEVKSLFLVSRNVFYPVPKVDSIFLKFDFYENPRPKLKDKGLFRNIVKLTFGKRRKLLKNSLKDLKEIEINSISELFDLNRRPEELTVTEFVKLTNLIYRKIN